MLRINFLPRAFRQSESSLISSLFLLGCRKTAPTVINPIAAVDIFTTQSNAVTNGQTIQFTLETAAKYTLVLFDTTTNQTVSKEKFTGVSGNNIKKIYTSTYPQKVLYLYLIDSLGNQIKKTKITIN